MFGKLRRVLEWLRAVIFLLLMAAVVGYAAWTLTVGGPPAEQALITLTGTLGNVRVAATRPQPSSTFTVTPPGGGAVDLHMAAFGRADRASAVADAQGQMVTVKYQAALLGNPVFAMAAGGRTLLSYAEATAAQARETGATARNVLALYVGGPIVLLGLLALLRRRARMLGEVTRGGRRVSGMRAGAPRPSVVLPARLTEAEIDRTRLAAEWRIAVPLLMLAALGLILGWQLATDPAMRVPFVGVFGERPLGIPATYAALACVLAGIAPLMVTLSHGMALLGRLWQVDTGRATGLLGMTLAIRRNWGILGRDDAFRRHLRWALRGLAVFVVLVAAWIWATARAAV